MWGCCGNSLSDIEKSSLCLFSRLDFLRCRKFYIHYLCRIFYLYFLLLSEGKGAGTCPVNNNAYKMYIDLGRALKNNLLRENSFDLKDFSSCQIFFSFFFFLC